MQEVESAVSPSGVLVVGSITTDVTAFADRLPRPGETVLGNDVTIVLGGKGANQAAASARFGTPTWMVGCVGDDPFAELASAGLRRHGVQTDLVRAVDGPTGVAHIRVDASGQNDIVITPLANTLLDDGQVDAGLAAVRADVSVLLLQLEIRASVTAHAAAVGARAGLTVVLDPAPAIPVPDDIWPHVDIVTPNETEASILTGIEVTDESTAARAGQWFLGRGVRHAVITLGDAGALLVSAGAEPQLFPSFPVEALDTTAAGDAFTGTLGAALAAGAELGDAVRYGMAAGALAVTRAGASASLPDREEVLALAASESQVSSLRDRARLGCTRIGSPGIFG
jgi:ribokinase